MSTSIAFFPLLFAVALRGRGPCRAINDTEGKGYVAEEKVNRER